MTSSAARFIQDPAIQRNIYKNANGTKVWFEEVNKSLGLTFRYGWTSSARFGLVRMTHIENNGSAARTVTVLDGCRNILPACIGGAVLRVSVKLTDMPILRVYDPGQKRIIYPILLFTIALFYVLAAMIRLAWFNMLEELHPQKELPVIRLRLRI